MRRVGMCIAFAVAVVLRAAAQDAFTPLIYVEEVAQTAKMIQQIQNELKEVSYIYQSLQNQIQSLKTLKVSTYRDFMDFLSGQASMVLSTESRLKNLRITVNGESYALSDVLGYWDTYTKQMGSIAGGTGTSDDEQAAYDLLGISPELIEVSKRLKDLATTAARRSTALADQVQKGAAAESKRIEDLVSQAQGNQSVVAGLQTSALLQAQVAQDLLELKLQTASMATNVAAFTADLERNGLPVARSPQDEAVVGEEIGNPLSADFFDSK